MTSANVELARRGFEAVLAGDLDGVGELLDPDVKWHGGDPSAEGACHGREQALRFMRMARSRRAGAELVDVLDAGDRVVVLIRRGGHDGDLVANVTTFRDDRAIEIVHFADPRDACAAVGLPAPQT